MGIKEKPHTIDQNTYQVDIRIAGVMKQYCVVVLNHIGLLNHTTIPIRGRNPAIRECYSLSHRCRLVINIGGAKIWVTNIGGKIIYGKYIFRQHSKKI